jgi:hypothetical protein
MDKRTNKLTVNRTIFYNDASGYYSRDRHRNITIYANADEWHIARGAYVAKCFYEYAVTVSDIANSCPIPDAFNDAFTDSDRETDTSAD